MEKYRFFSTFINFDSDPRFSPFLLYVRRKSGVNFVRRCFRDDCKSELKMSTSTTMMGAVKDYHYLFFIFIHCFERVAQLACKLFYHVALWKI